MAKWLPPYGFTCKVHHMDAKVGGTYRMSFTNFTTGNGHSFGGEYRELVHVRKTPLHGQLRRPEPARRNADDRDLEAGVVRNRARPSCRRDCLRRFRWRCAISAGRSRSRSWQGSSSPRSRDNELTPHHSLNRTLHSMPAGRSGPVSSIVRPQIQRPCLPPLSSSICSRHSVTERRPPTESTTSSRASIS